MTFDQSSITNTNTAAYAGSSGTYTGTSSGTYTGTSTTTGSWADSTPVSYTHLTLPTIA